MRGLHRSVSADLPDLLIRPLVLLVAAIVGLAVGPWSAAEFVGAQVLAAGLALAIGGTQLSRALGPKVSNEAAPITPWSESILPFWLIGVAGIAEVQVPLILIGVLGTTDDAGLYAVAAQIVGLVVFGLVSINMPLQGRVAAAWAWDDRADAQRLITEASRYGAIVGLFGGLALLAAPEAVLALFGEEYAGAAPALRLLALGQLVNAVSGPCRIVLLMLHRHRRVLQASIVGLAVTATMGALLIPTRSVTGAAAAATAGLAVWNVILTGAAWRDLRLFTPPIFWGANRTRTVQ